jgi:peptide/nickel transport system substrate-binding protein
MRSLRMLAVAIATVIAGSGCTAPAAERGSAGHQHDRDALRVVGPFEVHSVAPVESSGLFTRLEVAETLVSSDLEGELQPGLSPSWTDSSDGREWTFDLPAGATFHDGTPVTADAVAASLQAAYEESASPLAAAPVESIGADGDAVRIDLDRPYPSLPATLTHYSTAVLAPASWDGDRVTEVIGTGPYEIEDIELPARVEVTRFDDFRGEAPAIEQVSFQTVARAESRALMAVSDQADVVFGLEPAGRERVDGSDTAEMVSSLQPRSLMMKVNVDDPLLEDVRVRQALSLALDRESMADAVLREPELAATQLFPPSLTAWNQPDLEPLAHDTAAAAALLDEAGWTAGPDGVRTRDGQPLRLTLTTYPDRPELPALATAIQASLEEVGVQVKVDVTNSSEIPARHADGSLQLGLLAKHLALVTDPLPTVAETFAEEGSEWGVMEWRNDDVARAIADLEAGADEAAAEQDRATIATAAQEELPLIPVAWYRMNAAVSGHVDGFVMDPLERTWHLSQATWAS